MPTLPPLIATPYDTVYTVLNAARVRLNDAVSTPVPVSGKLLDSNQMFTQALTNAAWRGLQQFLSNLGYTRFKQEWLVYQLPPVASLDPSSQVRIDWFNYFDAANIYPAPVLPPDLIVPLKLWERQSGAAGAFVLMQNFVDGLPNWNKGSRNGMWEWRADGIYMPGATGMVDLRILYQAYLADFVDTADQQWYQQPVPIMRALDPLSYFICAEVAEGREDMDAEAFRAKGEAAAKLVFNRDIAMKARTNIRRQSRSGRLEGDGYGRCY